METQEARQKLTELFGKQIRFSDDFNKYFFNLKDGMQEDLFLWAKNCREGEELGSVPPKKEFKNLYVFFRKIGNNTRAILIKKQNSDFIEFILEGHKEYDDKRMELGYKKSSYYSS